MEYPCSESFVRSKRLCICSYGNGSAKRSEPAIGNRLGAQTGESISAIVYANETDFCHLVQCIQSIDGQVDEVLIGLDGRSAYFDLPMQSRHTILRGKEPLGYSRMVNRLAAQSRGAYLLLVNGNIVLDRQAVGALRTTLTGNAVVAGCQLQYADGGLYHSGMYWLDYDERFQYINRLIPGASAKSRCNVDAVTFDAAMIKREAFYSLGSFDENYGRYWQDMDFCSKAIASEFTVVFEPRARGLVLDGRSSLPLDSDEWQSDREYYLHKWNVVKTNRTLLGFSGGGTSDSPKSLEQTGLVSLVIAVNNQIDYTIAAINSIRQHADCEYELIVVDNGSSDGTYDWLVAQPDITVLRNHENTGVPKAWNQGLHHAKGNILMLLNNDILVYRGGIRRLGEAAKRHGISGQAGGMIFYAGDMVGGIPTSDRNQSQYVEGYALAFRRDVWESVGDFDERFSPAYCEDTDWCLRAKIMGYDWTLEPDCVLHFGQATSKNYYMSAGVRRNSEMLLEKHAGNGFGRSILIHREGAAGDIIMALSVAGGFRLKYPLASIGFSCHPRLAELPLACPDVNFVNVANGKWDEVIDLDGIYEREQESGKCIHPGISFCRSADVSTPITYGRIVASEEDLKWASGVLAVVGKRKIVLCGLRSTHRPVVNWREEKWLQVVDMMPDVLFVAVDSIPRPRFDRYTERPLDSWNEFWTRSNILDLTGETHGLLQVLALAQMSDAVLTVDTGVLHIAGSAETPMVALVACYPSQTRLPFNVQGIGLGRACHPAYSHGEDETCLDSVSAKDVVDALRWLWRISPEDKPAAQ